MPHFPPPRKRLGQHFLTDPRILGRIADALELAAGETVVEIGPGRGALTRELLARGARVVAIELDRALAARLREWPEAGEGRLVVVEADVLDVELAAAAGTDDFALAGNVPYYITTPILFHALRRPRPGRAVYLVQREVADRIVAPPGAEDYGALSVNVQALAVPRTLFRVPAGAFTPPPKVESAVIRVEPRADPVVTADEEARFSRFVQDVFGLRRKQMRRVLRTVAGVDAERAEAVLEGAGVAPEERPENLGPSQFAELLRAIGTKGPGPEGPGPEGPGPEGPGPRGDSGVGR